LTLTRKRPTSCTTRADYPSPRPKDGKSKERTWPPAAFSSISILPSRQREDGRHDAHSHILKHYAVFHASQVEGIPAYKAPSVEEAPWTRPEAADIILKNSGAVIRIGGDRVFYSPSTDHIQLAPESAFRGPAEFATTGLHELGHWIGHPSRLNRELQSLLCITKTTHTLQLHPGEKS
jgi:antirestriction protein ArdC